MSSNHSTGEVSASNAPERFGVYHLLCLVVFVFLGLFTITHHELWRDEIQHWSIAIASRTPADIFTNLQYENSPALWHLLLYAVTRVTENPIAMQWLHLLLATLTAGIFLRWAPFSRIQRSLFIFGYFPAYEYCVISRHYVLGSLLMFAFLALFPWDRKRSYPAAVMLFLLAQTSLFGLMIAGAGAVTIVMRWAMDRQSGERLPRNLVVSLGIVITGCMWSFIQILPEPDCILHPAWDWINPWRALQAGTTFWRSIVPLPSFGNEVWNTNVLDTFPALTNAQDIASLIVQNVLAAILIIATCFYLRKRPDALLFFFLIILACGALFYVKKLGYMRHHGHLYLALIGGLWIFWSCRGHPPDRVAPKSIGRQGAVPTLVTVILAIHVFSAVYIGLLDYHYPFSPNKKTADWIRTQGHEHDVLIAPSAVGYYLDREVWLAPAWRFGHFDIWKSPWRMPEQNELVAKARELENTHNKPVLIVWDKPLTSPEIESQVEKLAQFTEQVINLHERYYVYALRPTRAMTSTHH